MPFNPSPTALAKAIDFLTQPLSKIVPLSTINSLQQLLLSTFIAVPAWTRNARFTLTCSSAAPPRAIYACCVAFDINWQDWFNVLGGREFDLSIRRRMIWVEVKGIPGRIIVWKQALTIPAIHISAQELDPQTRVTSSGATYPFQALSCKPCQTVAQQLLYSDHEEEEADEMFAMISKLDVNLISPTPTRGCFNLPKSQMTRIPIVSRLAPVVEEDLFLSRPYLSLKVPRCDRNTPSPISSLDSSRSSSPSSTASVHVNARDVNSPCSEDSEIIINTAETKVRRYLYQGGQSTVLSGGVMLGKATPRVSSTPSSLGSVSECNGALNIPQNYIRSKNPVGFRPLL